MNHNFQDQIEKIADGLAENSFAAVDGFLTSDEVHSILMTDEFNNRKLHFKKAGIGRQQEKQVNESIRGDYIKWIEPSSAPDPIKKYFDKLDQLIPFVNQNLFLSLRDSEIHMTFYPVGTFYKRHLDQFRSDDHRKLSVICYLNPGWKEEEGGQLRMYLPQGPKDLFPISGRLVCFRSDIVEHEVLPATRERVSLTGWLVDHKLS